MISHTASLYAYVGKKTGKIYTALQTSPMLAKVAIQTYLRYEPKPDGYTVHRTLKEIEALMPKFKLRRFKIVEDGDE
jgi:hypothetical protein